MGETYRRARSLGLLLAGAGLLGAEAPAERAAGAPDDLTRMPLEAVIARHVEAHGGAGSWEAVRSLRITGSMTYLSRQGRFTLWRGRGETPRYLLESGQPEAETLLGYDGSVGWRGSRQDPGSGQRLGGIDLAMLVRESDFPTPLFDAGRRGYDLRLLGPRDLDGRSALGIEVRRADGLPEIWYLDPATGLEMGRDSPGSYFGEQVPMRTWFDDFRVVAGIRIPFRVESEWHVQEQVFQVETVEVNPAIDDARFALPRPEGMGPLLGLEGRWDVVASQSAHPGAPWRESRRTSTIEKLLGGALLQERYTTSTGHQVVRCYTYDRFRRSYRVTEISDATNYLDVQQGSFDSRGRLVVSNLETGTPLLGAGHSVHSRLTIGDLTPDGFRIEKEISTDGGSHWFLATRGVYARASP